MKDFKIHKAPFLRMFIIQYGEILGLELGLIICDIFTEINFFVFQLSILPIFILLLISKYNRSVTTIFIDVKNKLITLNLKPYLFFNKNIQISFKNLIVHLKWKWLLNSYSQVIEIKENNKLVAVIPIKGSIWNDDEFNNFIQIFKKLKEEGEIKATFN